MPVKPEGNETESEFINRCMSEEKESFPDQIQRYAVCKSKWDNKENMESEDITDDIDDLDNDFVFAKIESEEFSTLPTTDCLEKHKSAGYSDEYSKMACSKIKVVPDDSQQGGVVGMNEDFARTKFTYKPKASETMQSFMNRCMSDNLVRERKKDRATRSGFCYFQYQSKYIDSLAKGWR